MSPYLNQSSEALLRAQVLDEAKSWLRTPWHHEARVKGAGVDCAQFLIAVYVAAGLIEDFQTEQYSEQWHLNRDEPRFLAILLEHCREVDEPMPGDVIMFQYGRHAAHGSIFLGFNTVIHAYRDDGRVAISELAGSPLQARIAGYYRWVGFA